MKDSTCSKTNKIKKHIVQRVIPNSRDFIQSKRPFLNVKRRPNISELAQTLNNSAKYRQTKRNYDNVSLATLLL